MPAPALEQSRLVPGFAPETELERALASDPELLTGLAWTVRRWGHPEGVVGEHVGQMLACIEDPPPLRHELRFLALVHDSFKYRVEPAAAYSPGNDHAVLARRFAERYTDDERVLAAIELHDEPYWIWQNQGGVGDAALDPVIERMPDLDLFLRFVELDGSTEGKDPTLLWWLRHTLASRGLLRSARLSDDSISEEPDGEEVTYVKEFATSPDDQAEIAAALMKVVADAAGRLVASGEVLSSSDGIRVLLVWRWRGPIVPRLIRDGEIVERALADHPVLARARARDAHVFTRPPQPDPR